MSKSKGNNITYNNFKANMMGIGLDQSSDNLILNNIISFNRETGMWIGESSNNTIIGNIISSCADYGIFIRTVGSKNNIIFHNNFEYNQVNANDIGNNTWDDGYPSGGNFWHDYKREDFDGDGIGDTPYPIPGGDNEDRYPLIYPWWEPKAPIIDGPSSGKPGGEICFTFNSTDPDGDEVKYRINWGDGTIVETGYYHSCVPVEVCHTWNENNTYTILARAEDIRGYKGDWSEFKIKISNPRTRTFLRFLDMFPILQRILSYIL